MCDEGELLAGTVGAALSRLQAVDPGSLGDTDLLATVRDLLAVRDRVEATLTVLLSEAADRGLDAGRPAGLLDQLQSTPQPGARTHRDARRVKAVGAFPRALALVAQGRLSVSALDAAVRCLPKLPVDARPVLDGLIAAHPGRLTADAVERLVHQAAHLADPEAVSERVRELKDRLTLIPGGAGPLDPLHIKGTVHGPGAELVQQLLHGLARPDRDATGEPAPLAERLATALLQALRLAAAHPDGRPAHGADAHVVLLTRPETLRAEPGAPAPVTADGRTLTREQAEHAWCTGTHTLLGAHTPFPTSSSTALGSTGSTGSSDPELLAGLLGGLLPAPLAPVLEPLWLGRTARTATKAQWLALVARDRTCRHPGCSRPPSWCDAHHLAEWQADHGSTDLDNLVLLCWQHHADLHARHQHLIPDQRHPGTYLLADRTTWHRHLTRARAHPPARAG